MSVEREVKGEGKIPPNDTTYLSLPRKGVNYV